MRKKVVLVGMVVGIICSVLGCGQKKTPEQIVQNYLNKKYDGEFVVEELIRRGSGPIPDSMYFGQAYEKSFPSLKFNVWISKNFKNVYDSYLVIQRGHEIDAWMTEKGQKIWSECRIHDNVSVIRYRDVEKLDVGNVDELFDTVLMSHRLILCIPSHTDISKMKDNIQYFFEELGHGINGRVSIYLIDRTVLETVVVAEVPELYEYRWDIMLGASEDSIENTFG